MTTTSDTTPPAGLDPEAPAPRQYDYEAMQAGKLLEAALTRAPGNHPSAEEHRQTVLAFVARAWAVQPHMTLGGLLHRAAADAGGARSATPTTSRCWSACATSCTAPTTSPSEVGTPANTGPCRSCGAPMIWCLTEKGKRMPIDADPDEPRRPLTVADGNLIICRQGTDGEADTVRYVPAGRGRYRSHFASCPNSKSHRKGR